MAKDIYHNVVKEALIKDGWTITHDPYLIRTKGITYSVDLGCEQLMAALKEQNIIAVEIKSFTGGSNTYEFHEAIGQYLVYKVNMHVGDPDRLLFLAVPVDIYENLFQLEAIELAVKTYHLKLLVFDPENKIISKWKIN